MRLETRHGTRFELDVVAMLAVVVVLISVILCREQLRGLIAAVTNRLESGLENNKTNIETWAAQSKPSSATGEAPPRLCSPAQVLDGE